MAYTVLARRYRSSTFDEVVGQGHVAQTIKRAISSGRIAHAYLFCGTRGTGKTSMARILAKALNCLSFPGPTATPCGTCSSCVGIARGDDMDYVEIDAASNTQVDKTREAIIDNVAYRPARCRFKIFLIDEVHMLSKGSFNALLKTLEEPPEHVKFILATTEPEKIPNTILSRCQRYDFRNIPAREVAGHLGKICKDEGISATDDALLMVARAGGGSMRDSLSLLDRLLSVGEKTLSVETIEQLLGLPRGEQIARLVSAIGNGDAGGALRSADEILSGGMSPDSMVAGLIEHLHNLLLMRVCGEKTELVEAPGVPPELLAEQARQIDSVLLTQDIAVLEELRRQLRSGAGGRALMDATIVRLAMAEQFRSITELLGDVGPGGGGAAGGEKKKPELRDVERANPPAAGGMSGTRPAPTAFGGGGVAGPAGGGGLAEGGEKSVAGPTGPGVMSESTGPAGAGTVEVAVEPATGGAPTEGGGTAAVATGADESDDDLPRPGRVWDNSGPSILELLKGKSPGGQVAREGTTPVAGTASGGGGPGGPVESGVAGGSNVEAVSERALPAVWQGVLGRLKRSAPSVYGYLEGSVLGTVESGTAVVRFAPEKGMFARFLDKQETRERVTRELSEALGGPVGLRVEVQEAAGPGGSDGAAVARAGGAGGSGGGGGGAGGGGPVGGVVKPSLEAIRAGAVGEVRVGTDESGGGGSVGAGTAMGGAAVRLTEEVRAELLQDELLRAVVETLGSQIVKVTEEG